jgi:hypothetical protein
MNNKSYLGGCVIQNDIGTYAPQVWDKLIELYSPKSVIDVGCGAGHSLYYFLSKGISGIGVEGFEEAIKRSPVQSNIVQHDYVEGAYVPDNMFDLAWCCEFVEHVEETYLDNFMKTFEKCEYVAMTHAVPGQPGHHHVNCQPASYWIEVFKKYGFDYLENDSLLLRRTLYTESGTWTENGSHVRNTLMVFRKTK